MSRRGSEPRSAVIQKPRVKTKQAVGMPSVGQWQQPALPPGRPRTGAAEQYLAPPAERRMMEPGEILDLSNFGPQIRLGGEVRRGLGWLRDLPDHRDMTLDRIAPKLETTGKAGPSPAVAENLHLRATRPILAKTDRAADLDTAIDNRQFCSPIEDQGNLGSCTAQACAGLIEYMERRASGRHIDASRRFLYKVTRKLLGWTGDTGGFLRTTMKALVLFGAPPEDQWRYDISRFDEEPNAYLYAFAANFRAVQYLRLDPPDASKQEILNSIKAALASGFAVMFGFSVYCSMSSAADIPYPSGQDSLEGGHAMLIVGYDDNHVTPDNTTVPSLLIRNSWGTGWGDNGYGWLPYDYVLNGLADDFWTCYSLAWIDTGRFEDGTT